MKRTLAAVLALAALAASVLPWESEARDRRCRPARNGGRTGDCVSYAFFEAFPASGAGTTSVCSTTAPTGAKGEALTFTRASTAYCTATASGGLATTGIANGDLVSMSNNVARQEYDSAGVLGLRIEGARTNVLLRFIEIDTAVTWTDVATPTLTTGQVSPFAGTYATSAVTIDDNDATAFEGRTQSVTVSAGAAYTMYCYVKAGTSTKARISIDGTTQDISGLSTSTWSIIEKADASASGASIAAQVLVGNAASDVGSVTWGGCQVEAGSYRTSIIPTTTAAQTRAAETPRFTIPGLDPSASGCMFANLDYSNNARWEGVSTQDSAAMNLTATHDTIGRLALLNGWTAFAAYGGATAASQTVNYHGNNRLGIRWTGTNVTSVFAGATATGTWTAPASNMNVLQIGSYASAGRQVNTVMSRFQVDPDSGRCGQ